MAFKRSSSLRKSNEPGFKESRAQRRLSYFGDLESLASKDAILLKEPAPDQEHPTCAGNPGRGEPGGGGAGSEHVWPFVLRRCVCPGT